MHNEYIADDKFDNLTWEEYFEMSSFQKFFFHNYLAHREYHHEINGTLTDDMRTHEILNRLDVEQVHNKFKLINEDTGDEVKFSSCKNCAKHLGVSINKIIHNIGKVVNGYKVYRIDERFMVNKHGVVVKIISN